jgi:4-amino-4-deoxy-L-arabinose transferase-like glycosyltransferase
MALALALTAQSLLTQQPFVIRATENWSADACLGSAVGLLLAAMVCFAVATFGSPPQADESVVITSRQDKGFRALGPYLAASCYILSLLMYLAVGENLLVRFFWLTGVVLLMASQLVPPASEPDRAVESRATRWEWGLVAAITAVAFGLRYWRLASLPSDIDGDIASVGLQVLEIIHSSVTGWVGVGWSDHSLVFYQLAALSMRLFGQNLYGLMMGSVIAGTLVIPAVFLLGREMFGRRAGLVAAALLAVSYAHIHFSRVVFTETASLDIVLLFYFLFRALRTQQRRWFAFAGMALGWGLLAYYSSRIGPVIVTLLGMWLFLWKRQAIIARARNWGAFGLGALLGFGPQLGFAMGNFRSLVGRGDAVTLANPDVRAHLMGKYGVQSMGELLVEQIKRSFLVYHAYGDTSPLARFPGPMLDVLTAALLVLGLGYCLARLRNLKYFTLVVWIVSVLVLGGMFMDDPPYWPHLAITLPAVAVVAGLATVQVWELLARPMGRVGSWGLGTLLVAALVYTGIHNWQVYYDYAHDNAGERVRIVRYINSLPAGYQVRLVTTAISWRDREFQFLARGVAGQDLAPDQLRSDPQPCRDAPVVFILTYEYVDLEPVLLARCPGGQSQQHIEPSGRLSFVSYRLGPEGAPPPVVESSEAQVDSLAWLMLGGWALIMGLGLWLYYRFVVRRMLAKRALKQAVRLVAAPAAGPGGISPTAAWRGSLGTLERRPRHAPILRRLSDNLQGRLAAFHLQDRLRWISEWTPPRLTASQVQKAAIVWGVPLVALMLDYFAQSIFAVRTEDGFGVSLHWLDTWPESSRLWLGAFIYLAAMVAWMIFAPDVHATKSIESAASSAPPESHPSQRSNLKAWPLLILIASLVCYAPAMILFDLQGESALVRWLWASGVILFAASALLGLRAHRSAHPEAQISPHFGWIHINVLVAILVVAFWLRFYQLDKIPSDFHGDMGSHGLIARSMAIGEEQLLFHDTWANLPLLTFLPAAISLKVFGNNLFGLQMTSVLGGMMSLLGFYLLVWRLFDRHRLAALATALVAINVVHIHFSRIAEYMDPWPFAVWALFLVVDGLKARRLSSLALAGLLMGFSVQMYYSGRIVVFILAAFLIYALLFQRRWVAQNRLGLVLMVLGGLVALGPDLIFFARNWDAFMERSREVWLYGPDVMAHLQNKYHIPSVVGVTLKQFELSLLMFHHSIDSSSQFGFPHPMFSPLVSPLIVLGLGYGLRRWRSPGVVLMLAWLLLVMVVGSALTVDAPFWPRLVSIVLPAALLAALALDQLWSLADKLKGCWTTWVTCAAVSLLLIQVGWQTWSLYYAAVRDNARPRARIGRFLSSLPPQIAACSFLDPYELEVREIQFLAWPRKLVDLPSDAPDDAMVTCPGPPFAWILTPNHLDRLDALRMRWPDGVVEEHYEPNGTYVFTSFLVEK